MDVNSFAWTATAAANFVRALAYSFFATAKTPASTSHKRFNFKESSP